MALPRGPPFSGLSYLRNPKPSDLVLLEVRPGVLRGPCLTTPGGCLEIVEFQGRPGGVRGGSPKTRNPLRRPQRPPEAPRGPRRPPGGHRTPRRSLNSQEKAPKRSRKASAETRPGKPGREGGEWEFRALARNPKRYKVGWMPA